MLQNSCCDKCSIFLEIEFIKTDFLIGHIGDRKTYQTYFSIQKISTFSQYPKNTIVYILSPGQDDTFESCQLFQFKSVYFAIYQLTMSEQLHNPLED